MSNQSVFVDVQYLNGVLGGTKCRWGVVYGFEGDEFNSNADCYPMKTKPTKRQIRKLKKQSRAWREFTNIEIEREKILIDIQGMQ